MPNSKKDWELRVDSGVEKAFRRFSKADVRKLASAICLLPADPYFGDVQKMKGEHSVWRRRIGSYRVFYKLFQKEKVILLFRVERRQSKTYQ